VKISIEGVLAMSRGIVGWVAITTLGIVLTDVVPASACMFGRRQNVQTRTSYYQPAVGCSTCGVQPVAVAAPVVAQYVAPAPVVAMYTPPQPVAVQETRMVQRCYLAPVTTMQTQTQYENVTSYRTELYDEAITTMQTSAYYDPCGCGYKAVTTPVTSMVRKARQVPVTQTIARNYLVPVTTYEQRVAMEPVTETKLYYPATPAVAVAPAPVVAQYVAPAPAVAHYVAPTAVAAPPVANYVPAMPAPPTAVAAAPAVAPAPGVANYLPAPPPGTAPQPGQASPQFYQNPNAPGDNRTMIIERVVKNGQVIQENKRYLNPGEAVPPPQVPGTSAPQTEPNNNTPDVRPQEAPSATPSSMPWQPFPSGQGNFTATRVDSNLLPVSANIYYGTK
jgi:hypothetical protein